MELNDRVVFRPEIMRSFLRRIALLFVTWVLGVKRLVDEIKLLRHEQLGTSNIKLATPRLPT